MENSARSISLTKCLGIAKQSIFHWKTGVSFDSNIAETHAQFPSISHCNLHWVFAQKYFNKSRLVWITFQMGCRARTIKHKVSTEGSNKITSLGWFCRRVLSPNCESRARLSCICTQKGGKLSNRTFQNSINTWVSRGYSRTTPKHKNNCRWWDT